MPASSQGYQFDTWVFYPETDELVCSETLHTQKLEPQVARLLELFITQEGTTLSQGLLNDELWPDTIVEANSLYQLLTKLRKVLKDTPRTPKYIKTIPKKGYVFIAEVRLKSVDTLPNPHNFELASPSLNSASFVRADTLKRKPLYLTLFTLFFIACFSAIAFFNQTPQPLTPPEYKVEDISYELGLEFDIAAHIEQDLIAYVSQFDQLVIANKLGNHLYEHTFNTRVAHPSWHPKKDLVAFWQYLEDKCVLKIISSNGKQLHESKAISCDRIEAPIWQSDDELTLVVHHWGNSDGFLYRLSTQQFVKIPVPLSKGEKLIKALKAWENQTYFLVKQVNHHTKLITLDGNIHLSWPYPIWLAAFDVKQQTVITNDESKYHNLIATHLNNQQYSVMRSTQGIFSTLSIDKHGDIFAAAESWQVNIKDNDDLPIFSSSSIDYLPVSNLLGETAFMSRRTGVCEVYLHANDKIRQLSFHQGHEYVGILNWSPDNSLLLSNRDNDIVLYDRNRTTKQFASNLPLTLQNAGWINNEQVWGSDGEHVYVYDLTGRIIQQTQLKNQFVGFHHQTQQWLLLKNQQLMTTNTLDNFNNLKVLTTLSKQQANHFRDVRFQNQSMYWLSQWSKQDYIWQLDMQKPSSPTLKKSGSLIWHYDIKPDGSLLIAKMESVEGDIKKFAIAEQ
ncbi:transcriptional regulator [Pseudoalteromonas phenolica]|uniref:winged helix-turn-helix domain-containing protein n=1 Tax=Pseudoalteromonas phenolica TaxID=161398 RepID=UPI00110C0E9D|nr:winged helix-turn-helix domain-containing protein [Pseudoalteromonas phenolica]TMN92894.1 transcriptional regulator [Pseudoalteromonas phenolica]